MIISVTKEIHGRLKDCNSGSGQSIESIVENAILTYLKILALPKKESQIINALIENPSILIGDS